MLNQDIFIGVDGGGTQSKVRVEDAEGRLLGQAMGGPANIRVSLSEAHASIFSTLESILTPLDIHLHDNHYRFHAGFGLAGCEVVSAYQDFLNLPHPFQTLRLFSDAHAACVGAHKSKEGSIIIVGTGVVGYQMKEGVGTQVGGWGFPHDDEGGGAWLGLEATRLTFQWLDHRVEKSPLVADVFAFFNNNLEHFVHWANGASPREFARLAPLVINHAQQSETVATRLLKKAAHAVDRIAVALAKKVPQLPCCLLGGIAPFIETWVSEELKQILVPRQACASEGAILLIREELGRSV